MPARNIRFSLEVFPKIETMKARAPRNRTITLSSEKKAIYSKRLVHLSSPAQKSDILNKTICQDILSAVNFLPDKFVDLLFIDPPYNLDKQFNGRGFKKQGQSEYLDFLETYIRPFRTKQLWTGGGMHSFTVANFYGLAQVSELIAIELSGTRK